MKHFDIDEIKISLKEGGPSARLERYADQVEEWARSLPEDDLRRQEGMALAWDIKLKARGGFSF